MRNIYSNMGRFATEFMNRTGVSLIRVEDNLFYYKKQSEENVSEI